LASEAIVGEEVKNFEELVREFETRIGDEAVRSPIWGLTYVLKKEDYELVCELLHVQYAANVPIWSQFDGGVMGMAVRMVVKRLYPEHDVPLLWRAVMSFFRFTRESMPAVLLVRDTIALLVRLRNTITALDTQQPHRLGDMCEVRLLDPFASVVAACNTPEDAALIPRDKILELL
jgi:hypothetical protein